LYNAGSDIDAEDAFFFGDSVPGGALAIAYRQTACRLLEWGPGPRIENRFGMGPLMFLKQARSGNLTEQEESN